ncbi:MAG: ComEC/Rec2 family competence protein [Spirochaetales bacterium]|nr:MAG: ComEC/Rec2 family competence protein [Spirochaetales bacterium]
MPRHNGGRPIRPMVILAVGAAVVEYSPAGPITRLLACSVSVFLLVACVCIAASGHGRDRARWHPVVRMAACLALGLGAGCVANLRTEESLGQPAGGLGPEAAYSPIALEGRLAGDGRLGATGWRSHEVELAAVLCDDGGRVGATGRVRVFVRGGAALPRGTSIRLRLSSDISSGLPVFATEADLEIIVEAPRFERFRFGLRERALDLLARAGGRAGPLLEALVLGVRDDVDQGLTADFRNAGCAHILALSGQHVGILAALVAMVLGPLLGPFRAKACSCILLAFYLVVVGPAPSVVRAALMFWIAALARAMDRPQDSLNVLAIAFLLALTIDPASSRTISFQLSYLAVLGIAIYGKAYEFLLRRWFPPSLSGAAATGWAALSVAAPLGLIIFGRLNLFAPLVAMVAAPLVSSLMWLGLGGSLAVSVLPGLSGITGFLCALPYDWLARLMALAAAGPAIDAADGYRLLPAVVVALLGALVYAWLYASYFIERRRSFGYRPQPGGLQFAQGTGWPTGSPGLCHAQALRPELPGGRVRPQAYISPPGGGVRPQGLGSRAGRGRHVPRSARLRATLEHLRD